MKKLNLEAKIIIGVVSLFLLIGAMFIVTNNKGEFRNLKEQLSFYEYDVENKIIVTNNDITELTKELENQKQVYNDKLKKYNQIIYNEQIKVDKMSHNIVEEVKYKEELINNYFTEKYKELDFKKLTFKDGNEDEMVALGKINSELTKLAEAKFEELQVEEKQELITNYQKQIKEYEKLKSVVESRIASEKERAEAERIAKEQAQNTTPSGGSPLSGSNNSTVNADVSNNTNNVNNNFNSGNSNGFVTAEKVDNEPNYNGSSFYSYGKCPEENYPYVYNFVVDKCYTRNVPALCSQSIAENMFEKSYDARAYGIDSGRGWDVTNCGDGSWNVRLFDACSGTNEECGIAPEWS